MTQIYHPPKILFLRTSKQKQEKFSLSERQNLQDVSFGTRLTQLSWKSVSSDNGRSTILRFICRDEKRRGNTMFQSIMSLHFKILLLTTASIWHTVTVILPRIIFSWKCLKILAKAESAGSSQVNQTRNLFHSTTVNKKRKLSEINSYEPAMSLKKQFSVTKKTGLKKNSDTRSTAHRIYINNGI